MIFEVKSEEPQQELKHFLDRDALLFAVKNCITRKGISSHESECIFAKTTCTFWKLTCGFSFWLFCMIGHFFAIFFAYSKNMFWNILELSGNSNFFVLICHFQKGQYFYGLILKIFFYIIFGCKIVFSNISEIFC